MVPLIVLFEGSILLAPCSTAESRAPEQDAERPRTTSESPTSSTDHDDD